MKRPRPSRHLPSGSVPAEVQAAWGEEFDSYPCNEDAAKMLYPDGVPAIYTLKNFALEKVEGTDMNYAEYVAAHSSE